MLPLLRSIVCRCWQEVPAGGGGRKRAPARQRAFALREEDDGWEAIQDAQNAAATLALHAVRAPSFFWGFRAASAERTVRPLPDKRHLTSRSCHQGSAIATLYNAMSLSCNLSQSWNSVLAPHCYV